MIYNSEHINENRYKPYEIKNGKRKAMNFVDKPLLNSVFFKDSAYYLRRFNSYSALIPIGVFKYRIEPSAYVSFKMAIYTPLAIVLFIEFLKFHGTGLL